MGMRQLDVFQIVLPALSGIFIIGVGGFQTAAFFSLCFTFFIGPRIFGDAVFFFCAGFRSKI